jgi:phage protein D
MSDTLVDASGDNGGIKDIFTYATGADAQAAAKAQANRIARVNRTLTLTCVGRLDVVAGAELTTLGFRAGADYVWSVKSVAHKISRSGWQTTITAEGPNPES